MKLEQPETVREARRRLRVYCDAQVEVETGAGEVVKGRMRDVCLNSLYLFTDEGRDAFCLAGEVVRTKITIHRDDSALSVEQEGRVARMDDAGFVVQFIQPLRWWPVFVIFPDVTEQ